MDDLVTARLVLHPLSAGEAERVLNGDRDGAGGWADGYPAEGDVSAVRRFLATCAAVGDPRPFGTYEIRLREDGRTIGGVDFHGPPDEDGGVTIGYGLVPSAHGNGYASEALRALLAFARAQGVSSVAGDTDAGNLASQRVMTAAGMRLVAESDRLRFYRTAWDGPAGRRPT
ncbi:GNAT family N-acetyltransferase [Streptomyces sp. IBSBF 2435]|uniref:GNAT family N-acetyltransferase n=1 Tax=Streptomyces sp. IBSBF 2435 TaxID=2903531 RepID=UPI002FDC109D